MTQIRFYTKKTKSSIQPVLHKKVIHRTTLSESNHLPASMENFTGDNLSYVRFVSHWYLKKDSRVRDKDIALLLEAAVSELEIPPHSELCYIGSRDEDDDGMTDKERVELAEFLSEEAGIFENIEDAGRLDYNDFDLFGVAEKQPKPDDWFESERSAGLLINLESTTGSPIHSTFSRQSHSTTSRPTPKL
ncbi:hypothetical protein J6590_062842 [Homalodisca vitripennis]|nr:hypothetical protein J6590_062842 [Homalodisca vitripennis]